ncbi:NAD(P)H-dependent flavin oxidoreductase [Amphritea japonica]|uniref:Nitronate monooxygenase n=1 Tax=Amphritea japonica ATCC BAA-1530 TaxID=1278309 RepID=A0A7R6PAG9_9GAMM|nr:nitronate monooxygenase [Amphritea japonica]BBB25883.1 nitronate monooxygenase [Amphritea japonica ATCC BAA-1530]
MQIEELFGINLPLIQAPMAGAQDAALAIAVSEAGGLGSLPCAMLTPDQLRAELENIRAITNNPVNLNFFSHTMPASDTHLEQQWRACLQPYYQQYGIDPEKITSGATRIPFDYRMAEVLEEHRPAVVSFHFGLPKSDLLQRVRDCGCKILSSATTVAEARWLEQQGVDGIIAQGLEAGGHRGFFLNADLNTQLGTMALVPQIIAATDLPVIAAGGIADRAGIKAALSMGAAGVQLGTAFLLCDESRISKVHRQALQDVESPTALTNLFSGGPARGVVNRVMADLGAMAEAPPPFPLATSAIAPLRTIAEQQGVGDFSPLWSGQNRTGCRSVSAASLISSLFEGLEQG